MGTKVLLNDIVINPGPRRALKFNNPRSLAKIDIPGGPPIYQDMGEDETILCWDGVLTGDDAYKTALKLESLKEEGLPVQLTVSDFPELSKLARIRSFPWDVIRSDRVEYSIELVAEIPPPPVVVNLPAPAALPEAEQQAPAPPPGVSYTIKQGDTLWALAVKHYGDGSRWREIAQANGIMDPRKLQIGQVINIPG